MASAVTVAAAAGAGCIAVVAAEEELVGDPAGALRVLYDPVGATPALLSR